MGKGQRGSCLPPRRSSTLDFANITLFLTRFTFSPTRHCPLTPLPITGRKKAQQYFRFYKERIPVVMMVRELANIMQEYTQSGYLPDFHPFPPLPVHICITFSSSASVCATFTPSSLQTSAFTIRVTSPNWLAIHLLGCPVLFRC